MAPTAHSRFALSCLLPLAAFCLAGCAASLGPGYAIDKQEIHVQFTADPQPVIHIAAEYHLRNNGNQPLTTLELRCPAAAVSISQPPSPSGTRIPWPS